MKIVIIIYPSIFILLCVNKPNHNRFYTLLGTLQIIKIYQYHLFVDVLEIMNSCFIIIKIMFQSVANRNSTQTPRAS